MIKLDVRDLVALAGALALIAGAYLLTPAAALIVLGVLILLASIFVEVEQPTRGTDGADKRHS